MALGEPLAFLPLTHMVQHSLRLARAMALPSIRSALLLGPQHSGKRSLAVDAGGCVHGLTWPVHVSIIHTGSYRALKLSEVNEVISCQCAFSPKLQSRFPRSLFSTGFALTS